jgi:trimethylamine--corrinoid protein Co-methyltransferase
MPTHAYLGASDSKLIDAQAGFESGISALMGALAGINMISGAGMLDFLRAQSLEKLVVDAEIIATVRRLLRGIEARDDSLGALLIQAVGHHGQFLGQRHTLAWFAQEQRIPSDVVDRGSLTAWQNAGGKTAADRARDQVPSLLAARQDSGRSRPGPGAKSAGRLSASVVTRRRAPCIARQHGACCPPVWYGPPAAIAKQCRVSDTT